jgi:hypothetical protein
MTHLSTKQLELMHLAMAAWFEADPHGFTTIDLNKQSCGVYTPHTFEVYRGLIIGSTSVCGMFVSLDIGLSDKLGDLDSKGDWHSRPLETEEMSPDWELVAGLGRDLIDLFYYEHFRKKVYSYWRLRTVEQRIMNPYFRPFTTDEWFHELEGALEMMVWKGEGQMTERRFFLCGVGVIACNQLFPPPEHDPLYRFAEDRETIEIDV